MASYYCWICYCCIKFIICCCYYCYYIVFIRAFGSRAGLNPPVVGPLGLTDGESVNASSNDWLGGFTVSGYYGYCCTTGTCGLSELADKSNRFEFLSHIVGLLDCFVSSNWICWDTCGVGFESGTVPVACMFIPENKLLLFPESVGIETGMLGATFCCIC